jgi:sugar phosphate isomerase/epimerase
MYALVPSRAHGETYDPSHDVWQNVNPIDAINATDPARLHRVHVKGTRKFFNQARLFWGGLCPMQAVSPDLAAKAGVPVPAHEWDRHHYEAMLPGFGGNDSMDWRGFLEALMQRGYNGPFVIENEATNSAHTGNLAATLQGFHAAIVCLSPIVWPLTPQGYQFDTARQTPLVEPEGKDVPVRTMSELAG